MTIDEAIERARILLSLNVSHDVQEAVRVLEGALLRAPGDVRARRLLASASLRLGEPTRALVLLEALALERPDGQQERLDLAIALLATGKADAARTVLERAERSAPASARLWQLLGVTYERLGRTDAANLAYALGECSSGELRAEARRRATLLDIE